MCYGIMFKNQSKPYVVINKNNCKACLRCISYCRAECLKLSEEINDNGYQYAEYTGEGCTGCGDCYYTCPEPLAIEVHIPKRSRIKKEEAQA